MGTIPLPALDIRPPAPQPNLLDQYSRLMALKNQQTMQPLQQQEAQQQVQSGAIDLQQKQIQLKDQQAMQATMQQWVKPQGASQPAASGGAPGATGQTNTTGSAPDSSAASPSAAQSTSSSGMPNYDDLVPLAIKNGVSFQTLQGLQQHVLQMKAQAATIAKDQAQAGEAGAGTLQKKNGMIVDAITGVMNAPDAQLPQAIQQAAQQLAQNGLFDPPHVQQAMQLAMQAQQNPAAARQALSAQAASLGGFSKLVDDAQKQLTLKDEQGKTDPNSPNYAPSQASIALGTAPNAAAIRQGEAQQAAQRAAAESQATEGSRVRVAAAEGAARANIETQIARGSDAALATVPPHLVGPATMAATKAGTDYAQAQSVSQSIGEMVDAARKGNVVSYQLLPQEGALQITTAQGVHRINMAEIQNYGGGSLLQNLQGHIGKALSGQSIPPSVLTDMQQMQDVMQRGSTAKYQNDLATINQTYGAKFAPVQMKSTAPASGAAPGGPPVPAAARQGAVHSNANPFSQFGGVAH